MSRKYHLLRKFGITLEQYDALLRGQQNSCAVCKRPQSAFKTRLAVDHDHSTGEIRGLLCTHCNRYVVGRYRRESGVELLLAAHEYLAREAYTGLTVPPKKKKRKKKRHGKNRSARNANRNSVVLARKRVD